VLWPTRKEAMQITAIVFGFVLTMAIFLWGTDKILEFVLYDLILAGNDNERKSARWRADARER
jgi:preprotein translocase SecE subunit